MKQTFTLGGIEYRTKAAVADRCRAMLNAGEPIHYSFLTSARANLSQGQGR